jgi:hypothetical protein
LALFPTALAVGSWPFSCSAGGGTGFACRVGGGDAGEGAGPQGRQWRWAWRICWLRARERASDVGGKGDNEALGLLFPRAVRLQMGTAAAAVRVPSGSGRSEGIRGHAAEAWVLGFIGLGFGFVCCARTDDGMQGLDLV